MAWWAITAKIDQSVLPPVVPVPAFSAPYQTITFTGAPAGDQARSRLLPFFKGGEAAFLIIDVRWTQASKTGHPTQYGKAETLAGLLSWIGGGTTNAVLICSASYEGQSGLTAVADVTLTQLGSTYVHLGYENSWYFAQATGPAPSITIDDPHGGMFYLAMANVDDTGGALVQSVRDDVDTTVETLDVSITPMDLNNGIVATANPIANNPIPSYTGSGSIDGDVQLAGDLFFAPADFNVDTGPFSQKKDLIGSTAPIAATFTWTADDSEKLMSGVAVEIKPVASGEATPLVVDFPRIVTVLVEITDDDTVVHVDHEEFNLGDGVLTVNAITTKAVKITGGGATDDEADDASSVEVRPSSQLRAHRIHDSRA